MASSCPNKNALKPWPLKLQMIFAQKRGISPEERTAAEKAGDNLSIETIESYHSQNDPGLGSAY